MPREEPRSHRRPAGCAVATVSWPAADSRMKYGTKRSGPSGPAGDLGVGEHRPQGVVRVGAQPRCHAHAVLAQSAHGPLERRLPIRAGDPSRRRCRTARSRPTMDLRIVCARDAERGVDESEWEAARHHIQNEPCDSVRRRSQSPVARLASPRAAAILEFTKDTPELVFKVKTDPTSPAGKHGNVFCQVTILQNGEPIVARAGGTELQIDQPLPPKANQPAPKPAPVAVARAPQPKPQVQEKPLSRLEKLRLSAKERARAKTQQPEGAAQAKP